MKKNRTILITKNFNIYIPEIYGIDTWGDGYHQEEMHQDENGNWFIEIWRYGGNFNDETTEKYKVEVLATFEKVKDAKDFLRINGKSNKIQELDILVEMYKKYIDCTKKDKNNEKEGKN